MSKPTSSKIKPSAAVEHPRLKANLKQLRLPMMLAEHAKLIRETADSNQDYLEYLLRLSELELASRASNALQQRLHTAAFPIQKELDIF